MKKIAIILAASMAISGCAQVSTMANVGAPVLISGQGGNGHKIMPGMKGKWSGHLKQHYQSRGQNRQPAALYISGVVKTQHLKSTDISLFNLTGTGCTYAIVFTKSEVDGTVIFRKLPPVTTSYCEQGFVRAQPMNDGTLRVSEHDMNGRETSAAIFSRMNEV